MVFSPEICSLTLVVKAKNLRVAAIHETKNCHVFFIHNDNLVAHRDEKTQTFRKWRVASFPHKHTTQAYKGTIEEKSSFTLGLKDY